MDKQELEKLDPFKYSQEVAKRFCTLLRTGKIMLNDQMMLIEELCNIMNPQTLAKYPGSYNSKKYAVENGKLMYFKIADITFIPEQ